MIKIKNIFIVLTVLLSIDTPAYFKNTRVVKNKKNKISFKKKDNHYTPEKKINNKTKPKKELITVFIHGTIIAYPSLKTTIKTLKGDKSSPNKKRSFFHKYTLNQRFNGVYQYQPINEIGLKKVELDKKTNQTVYEISSQKISNIIESINTKYSPNVEHSYYTFGWSGRLNRKRRKRWASQLYNELIKEISKRKKNKNEIEIQILAHSHGGNVALNLADIETKQKKGLKIKNLILFGTPIQKGTSDLIYSDIFEKIYSFYSKGDNVQIIDIISSKNFKSHRKFKKTKKNLPSKLIQIEVKCDKLKPSHTELWLLREKYNLLYRRRLSIFPYPISAYSPEIIRIIDKNFKDSINIKINIRKSQKTSKIKNKTSFDISFKDFDSNKPKKSFIITMPF